MSKLTVTPLTAAMEFYRDTAAPAAGLKPGEVIGSTTLCLSFTKPNGLLFIGLGPNDIKLFPISFPIPQPSLPEVIAQPNINNLGESFFNVPCVRTDTKMNQWLKGRYVFGLKVSFDEAKTTLYTGRTLVTLIVA